MTLLAAFLALSSFVLPGTLPADQPPPPGVVVSGHFWGRTEKTYVHPYFGNISEEDWNRAIRDPRARRRLAQSPPPQILIRRETYALVRNMGTRTIKNVTWDYIFYSDEAHQKEMRRFKFETKETLKPGEMKFLTENVDEPALSPFDDVVVQKIQYDDGSTWERAKPGA